jgi:hypothetical protein
VVLARTGVSEERIASIIRVKTISEVAVITLKNVVFWDVTPYGSCKNRRFEGTERLHHQGDKNR